MFSFFPDKPKFDFMGMQKISMTIAIVSFTLSVVLIFTKGFNYGIDFTGGAVIQVKFNQTTQPAEVRRWLENEKINFSQIQQIGETHENEFQLKLQGNVENLQQLSNAVSAALTKQMAGAGSFEIRKTDVVGPQAGEELRWSSIWATVYAMIGIVIYVLLRFDMRYSPGALFATGHDVVLILGAFVITQHEFNLQIVAAVLAIMGYSINDTIIVYDRIRETLLKNPKGDLKENLNESINSTLGRTINTSITTLLSSLALFVFGGGVIREFAEALIIGILVGTYSSIFVASPIFMYMAKRQERVALKHKLA